MGVTVVDLSEVDDSSSGSHSKFAGSPDEANPALGVRAYRTSWEKRSVLTNQLDAIAAAAAESDAKAWVMAPMISTVEDVQDFIGMCRERGISPAGIMVETPSAAVTADRCLAECDFASIGTNDLTQYTMAADRMSADLASLTDPWQPAVLHLIGEVGKAGQAAGKSVGVCGEAAADPTLACVLVGLGVTSLSSAPVASAAVGAKLASVTLEQCQKAAAAALATSSPAEARTAAADALG